jgi:hypothetical protein
LPPLIRFLTSDSPSQFLLLLLPHFLYPYSSDLSSQLLCQWPPQLCLQAGLPLFSIWCLINIANILCPKPNTRYYPSLQVILPFLWSYLSQDTATGTIVPTWNCSLPCLFHTWTWQIYQFHVWVISRILLSLCPVPNHHFDLVSGLFSSALDPCSVLSTRMSQTENSVRPWSPLNELLSP